MKAGADHLASAGGMDDCVITEAYSDMIDFADIGVRAGRKEDQIARAGISPIYSDAGGGLVVRIAGNRKAAEAARQMDEAGAIQAPCTGTAPQIRHTQQCQRGGRKAVTGRGPRRTLETGLLRPGSRSVRKPNAYPARTASGCRQSRSQRDNGPRAGAWIWGEAQVDERLSRND